MGSCSRRASKRGRARPPSRSATWSTTLVGPSARARGRRRYTLADAQLGYERLLADLESLGGSVGRAFEAKAYGLLNGGAAAFEAPPTYGDDFTIFSSIFFNNYGRREIHPDAGCVGWNWGAPFKLGYCVTVTVPRA